MVLKSQQMIQQTVFHHHQTEELWNNYGSITMQLVCKNVWVIPYQLNNTPLGFNEI
jgi:hypothetical protein